MSDAVSVPRRTSDPREAEHVVGQLFVPHRVHLEPGTTEVRMRLEGGSIGRVAVGRLGYGRTVRMVTEELVDIHVDVPLRGTVSLGTSTAPTVTVGVGQAAVFDPGVPAELTWSADAVMLCLMVARDVVEDELARAVGRSLPAPLSFDLPMDLRRGPARAWRPLLRLVAEEVARPTGLADLPGTARHVEAMLLEGLLHAQHHNHSDLLAGSSRAASAGAVARAARLMRERPSEAWTTARLATEVHLGVRALQEGFQRDHGVTPTGFLREVRLRVAREELQRADAAVTTVQGIAARNGFLHAGRFASTYAAAYGETPGATLRRSSG